jgi:branched-chain amino acid transport system ATP-binding protein
MSALTVAGLSKNFGGLRAVSELSFTVEEGQIFSIIGPNGAGKTTVFNLITGVYRPDDGRVWLHGEEIGGKPPSALAALGLTRTFQNLQIFFNMSALENVMVGADRTAETGFASALLRLPAVRRRDARAVEQAIGLMERVGLAAYLGADASSLPYGALKRLEIARALATRPKLLLLDEPAAGLNHSETREIDDLIRSIAEDGVTVILVEHDMRLVMGISDRILVLDRGARLAEGSAEDIGHDPDVVRAYLGTGFTGSADAA